MKLNFSIFISQIISSTLNNIRKCNKEANNPFLYHNGKRICFIFLDLTITLEIDNQGYLSPAETHFSPDVIIKFQIDKIKLSKLFPRRNFFLDMYDYIHVSGDASLIKEFTSFFSNHFLEIVRKLELISNAFFGFSEQFGVNRLFSRPVFAQIKKNIMENFSEFLVEEQEILVNHSLLKQFESNNEKIDIAIKILEEKTNSLKNRLNRLSLIPGF